jgi:glutamine cyclotransferase
MGAGNRSIPVRMLGAALLLILITQDASRGGEAQVELARKARSGVPIYVPEVIAVWPHDPDAFTQGLVYHDGFLYESTGLNGQSSLRQVELRSGRIAKRIDVPDQFFAEGIALLQDRIYQLTWTTGKSFVYDLRTFGLIGELSYTGEGWGLTTDGSSLLLSDGSNRIRFLDPATLATQKTIEVFDRGAPVTNLNELEYAKGEIFANIWHDDRIVRIDPRSGQLLGWLDLSRLYPSAERPSSEDVLNGIAYDSAADRFFITGKRWPRLFEIKLREVPPSCYVIRRIDYPVRKRSNPVQTTAERIALLDVCPTARGQVARPVIEITANGRRVRAEFDVVRLFQTEEEARDYASLYGIDVDLR